MITNFYQCPYCRRGEGVVAIDTAAAVVWLGQHPDATDFFVSEHPEQRVVRFDADRVDVKQCPHFISGSINIECSHLTPDDELQKEQAIIAELAHPWFADQDTDHSLDRFLWSEVLASDGDGTFLLTTPYHIQRVDCEHEDVEPDGSARQFRFYGRMIAAMEPDQFFLEFRAGAEQCWSAVPTGS
ncbi:MAG: hypothetical protein WCJ35_15040 [Planctomycetota bacterium]